MTRRAARRTRCTTRPWSTPPILPTWRFASALVVPAGVEEEFVTIWRSTIDQFATAPGFIATRLHHNTGLKDTAYGYVNVAHWESFEAYHAAFDGFTPAGQRIPGVVAHPGLFDVTAEITIPTAARDQDHSPPSTAPHRPQKESVQ